MSEHEGIPCRWPWDELRPNVDDPERKARVALYAKRFEDKQDLWTGAPLDCEVPRGERPINAYQRFVKAAAYLGRLFKRELEKI